MNLSLQPGVVLHRICPLLQLYQDDSAEEDCEVGESDDDEEAEKMEDDEDKVRIFQFSN